MMSLQLTRAVRYLVAVNFICFLIQQTGDQFLGTHLSSLFGLSFGGFFQSHYYWQIFTYSFLHSEVVHLFFNLMILVFVGSELEQAWGSFRFLSYYFFCSISTGFAYLLLQSLFFRDTGIYAPFVGASGALYGLFTAYGLIFGERVILFMMMFPIKAKHSILILVGLQLMTTIYTPGGAWSGFADLTGMGAGFVYLWVRARWILNQKSRALGFLNRSQAGKKKKRSNHLKLVGSQSGAFEHLDSDSGDHPRTWH